MYGFTASPVTDIRWALGAILMTECACRFPTKSGYGSNAPRELLRAAWDDHGYCIDAPETLPAGGCFALDLPPIDPEAGPEYMPAQLTVERA